MIILFHDLFLKQTEKQFNQKEVEICDPLLAGLFTGSCFSLANGFVVLFTRRLFRILGLFRLGGSRWFLWLGCLFLHCLSLLSLSSHDTDGEINVKRCKGEGNEEEGENLKWHSFQRSNTSLGYGNHDSALFRAVKISGMLVHKI